MKNRSSCTVTVNLKWGMICCTPGKSKIQKSTPEIITVVQSTYSKGITASLELLFQSGMSCNMYAPKYFCCHSSQQGVGPVTELASRVAYGSVEGAFRYSTFQTAQLFCRFFEAVCWAIFHFIIYYSDELFFPQRVWVYTWDLESTQRCTEFHVNQSFTFTVGSGTVGW